ncbi:small ribosomal subunit protein mS25 isoform X1 [Bos taurus]|uniref:small ribosomal subunit protein mS25 isoform X1 n=1 Tax=Bos taurus TaxID=9913 RepID=UPI000383FEE8|nr:small ribosomal subunit protein mS25 isoform X1 [Bos taurus]
MPMKGRFPIRRTLQYLSQGDVVFKDSVKVMTVNYNTHGELGEGARFWGASARGRGDQEQQGDHGARQEDPGEERGDPPEGAAGAGAALPPGALRAPEVLPAGVHLRGGGPGALPGRGAAAQGADRQVPGRPESRRPGLRPREPRCCAPGD